MIKKCLIVIYEYFYELKRIIKLRFCYRLHIMSTNRTLNYIYKKQCSIARFGDGEFDLIIGRRNLRFQDYSKKISTCLEDVLSSQQNNLLICVPRCYNSLIGLKKDAKKYWLEWGKWGHQEEYINLIKRYKGNSYLFGDAFISRPYIDWKHKKRAIGIFKKLKRLWEKRDLLIVEGEQTRLGVGNDLFESARSIKRIIVPTINAFDSYESIKNSILDVYNNQLVLLAIGPTATILAYELSKKNIQTLDIGHVDIEYEWFLRGAKEKIAVEGKYVNEVKEGRVFSECYDSNYLNQIVCRIMK